MSLPSSPIRAVIVGCGNVAKRYAEQIKSYPEVVVTGFSDMMPERAAEFAANFGGKAYQNLEEVLADPDVDLVVNLTIHHAHVEVITKCLEAGKHVHTEKPLALHGGDALRLVALAAEKGLRFSSAPITFMGEAHQTAMKEIRAGKLGPIRLIYAEVNHGRIEAWHPNPEPFYQVGPLWDVGIYAVTAVTAALGPVREVRAWSHIVYPNRVTKEGRAFTLTTPDLWITEMILESGAVCRLTANFYAGSKQGGNIEYIGDLGSLHVGNFQAFQAPVEFQEWGKPYGPVPHLREPFQGVEFGRGVQDLAQAILENRPHRASAAHAAHVIEVICGMEQSAKTGEKVAIGSNFPLPVPMDWAV